MRTRTERASVNDTLAQVFADGWTLLGLMVLLAVAWPLVAGAVVVWMALNVVFEAVAPAEADRAADGWGTVPIGIVLILGAIALGSAGGAPADPDTVPAPPPAAAPADPAGPSDELHLDELAASWDAFTDALAEQQEAQP